MPHIPVSHTLRVFISLVCLGLVAASCTSSYSEQTTRRHSVVTFADPCIDQTVAVSSSGVDTDSLPVCGGQMITWTCKDTSFPWSVDFEKSPFKSERLHFDDRDCNKAFGPTKKLKDPNGKKWDTYKYIMVVNNNTYFDPHVIIVPGSRDGQ